MAPTAGTRIKAFLRSLGIRRPAVMHSTARRFVQRRLLAGKYPRFGTLELLQALERLDISAGSTVFVHSAWDEFYNFNGKPVDVVRVLLDSIGPSGTLGMPAFPLRIDPAVLFDVRRSATGAGLIAETFRRSKSVRRSINLYHSVVAVGPHADYLVRDHHRSLTSWDQFSPYSRLAELDAKILCLGLPRSFGLGTCMHCPESLLYDEVPYFKRVFGRPVTYRYRDHAGNEGIHTLLPRVGHWHHGLVASHLDHDKIRIEYLSNLRMQLVPASYLVNRMVELARQGIVNYYWPWPRRKLFVPTAHRSAG